MKVKITRPDGTIIEAEGTPEEIKLLLDTPAAITYPVYPIYPTYPTYPLWPYMNPQITWDFGSAPTADLNILINPPAPFKLVGGYGGTYWLKSNPVAGAAAACVPDVWTSGYITDAKPNVCGGIGGSGGSTS